MAKNIRILHNGMGWPIGSVVPPEAFPHGIVGHLALGAVQETDLSATSGVALTHLPPAGDDPTAENKKLRGVIRDLDGKLAGANAELTSERAFGKELAAENEKLQADLEAAKKVLAERAVAVEQARLEAGPVPNLNPAK